LALKVIPAARRIARRRRCHEAIPLVEQRRAAAMAVHQRAGQTEVEVDAGRREPGQARGILGQAGGIGAHQLHPHRRAGGGAARRPGVPADAGEALLGSRFR